MTKRQLTGTGLALLLSAVAPGAFAQVASTNPGAVKAGTYKVEPYHTQVVFSVSHSATLTTQVSSPAPQVA
jgi:polyisoprenoid-binding protein YceI